MTRKHRRSTHDLTLGFGLAGMHTAMTLWYRLPMMAGAFGGTNENHSELARMVSEKSVALLKGALDANLEMMRTAGAAMTGKLDIEGLAGAPAAIAAAGLRPAFRTVRANSRRLHRQNSTR
jgi:hypothetical protein